MKQYTKPATETQVVDVLEMLCISVDPNQTTGDGWARKHIGEDFQMEEDKPWDFSWQD